MKIFAAYLKVDVPDNPQWLEKVLNKYGDGYDLHITLIQPRYVEESSIPEIKEIISGAIERVGFTPSDLNIYLDRLVVEKEKDGTYTAMLMAKENQKVNALEELLKQSFSKFSQYLDSETQEYERNFRPHITLASNVGEDSRKEIENYPMGKLEVAGVIESLILAIVNDTSKEERTNPDNLLSFELI